MVDASAPFVRYAARTPEAVDQIPDCSRESVATIPASRSVAGASAPGVRGEDFEGRCPIVPIDPLEDVAHGELFGGGGVEQRGEQRAGSLGPVMLPGGCPLNRLAPTIASAVTTAASQSGRW